MATLEELEKNRDLVHKYRSALGWDRVKGVGDIQKEMMNDIEEFCGLNQARFNGSESDMIKLPRFAYPSPRGRNLWLFSAMRFSG